MKSNTDAGNGKPKRNRSCRAGAFVCLLLIVFYSCGFAGADYFTPAPSSDNIVNQTSVSVALTIPATRVSINISEYDAQQIVKNITVDFREPVSYVSLVIDILKDKPLAMNAPNTGPVIQYYSIRFLTGVTDKITNVTIVFAIEKATLQDRNVDEEETLLHYQYDGSKFEACPTRKVDENSTFLLFETETKAYPYFAITGNKVPAPWWVFLVATAAVTVIVIIGAYGYRRHKSKRLQDPVIT